MPEDIEVCWITVEEAVCTTALWKQLVRALPECCGGFMLTPMKTLGRFLTAMAGGVTLAKLL